MLTETIVLGALWVVAFSLFAFVGKAQIDKIEKSSSIIQDLDKRAAVLENKRTETRIDRLDAQLVAQNEELTEVKQALFGLKTDLSYIKTAVDEIRQQDRDDYNNNN